MAISRKQLIFSCESAFFTIKERYELDIILIAPCLALAFLYFKFCLYKYDIMNV